MNKTNTTSGAAPKGSGVLRAATRADAPSILALINQNLDTLLPRNEEELLSLLDTTWVIDESGQIAGCCTLEVYGPKIAEVRNVAVHSEKRGLGYGTMLVERAVQEAQARKVYQILAVTSSLEFFKSLNFGPCLNEKYALFWNGH